MRPAYAETSDRYEKIDDNVLRMKPMGRKPRRRILTPFGKGLVYGNIICAVGILIWYLLTRG